MPLEPQRKALDPNCHPEAVQESDGGQDRPPANRETGYRTERNEARAQVAELTERISRMQETEATRLAADLLHNPSDLVLFGAVADTLDDDGMVDPEKVRATAQELIVGGPGLAKGTQVPTLSFGQGRRTWVDSGSGADWGIILRGRETRGLHRPVRAERCHRPVIPLRTRVPVSKRRYARRHDHGKPRE